MARRRAVAPALVAVAFVAALASCAVRGAYQYIEGEPKRVRLHANGAYKADALDILVNYGDFEGGAEAFAARMGKHMLVPLAGQHVAPDRVYSETGRLMTEFADVRDNDDLYLVPPGLPYVYPFRHVGHRIQLPQEVVDSPVWTWRTPVTLVAMSDSPRVFIIEHMFSEAEADELVANVESITDPDYRLERSSVGANTRAQAKEAGSYSTIRTSQNAFDSSSVPARAIIHRAFDLARLLPFSEDRADGLQIVRYEPGEAYIAHNDWFDDASDASFNFQPAAGGANRIATVFLYLNDVELGGQTVFPRAAPPPDATGPTDEVRKAVDELFPLGGNGGDGDGDGAGASNGSVQPSWERNMVLGQCYSNFAVTPRKATAALFYSMRGDGVMDEKALHGACPVLRGLKWGANLWLWNRRRHGLAPRAEGDGADGGVPSQHQVKLTIVNRASSGTLVLTWNDQPMGEVAPGASVAMNSYNTHSFAAHVVGEPARIVSRFSINVQPHESATTWTIGDNDKDEL